MNVIGGDKEPVCDLIQWHGRQFVRVLRSPFAEDFVFRARDIGRGRARQHGIHRDAASAELMLVQLVDGLLRLGVRAHLDEREAAGATGFPIEGTHDLRRLTNLRKVRTQVVFGCLVRQIAYEQSDWWHG